MNLGRFWAFCLFSLDGFGFAPNVPAVFCQLVDQVFERVWGFESEHDCARFTFDVQHQVYLFGRLFRFEVWCP